MEFQPGKIMIIDDEPIITNMLTAILENDYSIVSTDNSFTAISLAKKEAPDLILLDINMPLFDGHELCRVLKSEPETKQIPIIFLTARTSAEEESKGLEAGAVDYITKPITPSIVLARVKIQIEFKQQREFLEKLSTTDPLTGVANRRYFDESLEREWRRGQRNKKPLSLLAIDIDCFKLYNDFYGHLDGDQCLIKVAHLLKDVLHRGGDLFARIGGEEFIALLPDTPFEPLHLMAEKFRTTIENAALPHEHSTVSDVITISVGGTTLIPARDKKPIDLYRMADEQLYAAKEKGRNQACLKEYEPK